MRTGGGYCPPPPSPWLEVSGGFEGLGKVLPVAVVGGVGPRLDIERGALARRDRPVPCGGPLLRVKLSEPRKAYSTVKEGSRLV